MFEKKGVIVIEKAAANMSEDDLMLIAIDAGAENFEAEEEVYEITTSADDFSKVREELEKNGLSFLEASVQMVPNMYSQLDEEGARKMGLLLEKLDELDDVIEVYHNWDE